MGVPVDALVRLEVVVGEVDLGLRGEPDPLVGAELEIWPPDYGPGSWTSSSSFSAICSISAW